MTFLRLRYMLICTTFTDQVWRDANKQFCRKQVLNALLSCLLFYLALDLNVFHFEWYSPRLHCPLFSFSLISSTVQLHLSVGIAASGTSMHSSSLNNIQLGILMTLFSWKVSCRDFQFVICTKLFWPTFDTVINNYLCLNISSWNVTASAAPARTVELPEDYLERVKKTHEEGGYGSIGSVHYSLHFWVFLFFSFLRIRCRVCFLLKLIT